MQHRLFLRPRCLGRRLLAFALALAGLHPTTLPAAQPSGRAVTWGYGAHYKLGTGTTTNAHTPVAVDTTGALAGKAIVKIVSGDFHTLALDDTGQVYSWGSNGNGQLGDATFDTRPLPVPVDQTGALAGKTVIDIAAGDYHSLALTSDGLVFAWGRNLYGQLGNATTASSTVPVAVDTAGVLSSRTVTAITAGTGFSVALADNGRAYAWGDHGAGLLGDGYTTSQGHEAQSTPVAVGAGSPAFTALELVAIEAGSIHTLALTSTGQVWAWGRGQSGELGTGSVNIFQVNPVAVDTSGALADRFVVALSASYRNSYAVTSDGEVFAWGGRDNAALGDGTTTGIEALAPVAVDMTGALAGQRVIKVAAGFTHVIVQTADHQLYGWGYNVQGAVGNGSANALEPSPVAVDTSSIFTAFPAAFIGQSPGQSYVSTAIEGTANQVPTALALSGSATVNQSAAANTLIGTLSTTDGDIADTHTYTLIPGTGADDNAAFVVSNGNELRIVDPGATAAGTRSVRLLTQDPDGGFFAQAFTITVVDDLAPTITSPTSLTFTYGQASTTTITASEPGVTFTATGLPAGLGIDAATGAITGAATVTGSFTATVTATDGASQSGSATLTITVDPVSLTLTGLAVQTRAYDGTTVASLNLSGATLVGLVGTDSVDLDTTSASATFADANTGTAKAVTVTGLALTGADAAHYTLVPPTGLTGTITSATATVTLGNLDRTYDGSPQSVSAVTDPGSLNVTLTYGGAATPPTDAGSYAIAASITSPNYSGSASGTLVIAKAAQTITFAAPTTLYINVPATLAATASTGLPVTFAVTSGAGVIESSDLTITSGAPVVVTARQAGNANYLPASASLTLTAEPFPTSLISNLSARTVATGSDGGDQTLIVGFVLADTTARRMLLRAVGPGLTGLNVPNVLADPAIKLFDVDGVSLAANDDWDNDTAIAELAQTLGAFPLETDSADAALEVTLPAGVYSLHVTGGTGAVLAEIYDGEADLDQPGNHLINVSTRAYVESGRPLIGGLVIDGAQPQQVLVRGIGPGLAGHGVSSVLLDPVLTVYDANGDEISTNTGWDTPATSDAPDAAAIAAAAQTVGAFALLPNSEDTALLLNLEPGVYTVHLSSAEQSNGVALLEIYEFLAP